MFKVLILSILLSIGLLANDYNTAMQALKNKEYKKAMSIFNELSDKGDAQAQTELGHIYVNGLGVKKDVLNAKKYWEKAAEKNNVDALYYLGLMYYKGVGVTQDYRKSLDYWKRAAKQNDGESAFSVGYQYEYGQGVKQDYNKAIKYYKSGSKDGNANASNSMGIFYEKGKGVPVDRKSALKWYQKAAEQGSVISMYNIGLLYYNGTAGIKQDHRKSLDYWKRAAEQGFVDAEVALGILYEETGDIKNAQFWYKKAIAQGSVVAQNNLKNMSTVSVNPAPFGLKIDEATYSESIKKYPLYEDAGINKYSNGKMIFIKVDQLHFDGLKEAKLIFSQSEKLQGVLLTLPKEKFDDLYSSLSHKYTLVDKNIPFVGDKYAKFVEGNTIIELKALHIGFQTTLQYIDKKLMSEFTTTTNNEKIAKKKQEESQL
ncbi:tetratricopeptide repeat protein [Sulfurimonas sp.]|uniref:tetratricopeptide repeat protein n=1 Tax=Sulfurimonas sp. TaxID=2022749 RepID=UPI0025FC817D|nr:tetratricopeptide repeat protein [Sulfurimonas sp.]MCK9454736.1 sel1 repeat family protein [Sulfurimonas sp.]